MSLTKVCDYCSGITIGEHHCPVSLEHDHETIKARQGLYRDEDGIMLYVLVQGMLVGHTHTLHDVLQEIGSGR